MKKKMFRFVFAFVIVFAVAALPTQALADEGACENDYCECDDCDGEDCDCEAAEAEEVCLSVYFHDENFLERVRYHANVPEGALTHEDLYDIYQLSLEGAGIRCLVGIHLLPNLRYLYLSDNNLTELDVSQNTNLVSLNVHHNFFESEADIIGLREETEVYFGTNPRSDYHPEPCPRCAEDPAITPPEEPNDDNNDENGAVDTDPENDISDDPPRIPAHPPITEPLNLDLPPHLFQRLGGRDGSLTFSVDVGFIDGQWRVWNPEVVEAAREAETGTLSVVLTWVLIVLVFLTFIASLWLLIIRIRS